jgi:uncharacterized protein YbbC (DUF1343 family)
MRANISLTKKILKLDFPLFRFYGDNKPKPEQLAGIDYGFDLQDVGARFYTYISVSII